jgi:hypothetical protein
MSRKFQPVGVPEHSHPLVRRVFEEMNAQRYDTTALEAAAGVSASCIRSWRTRRTPRVDNLEAALNSLGFELRIHKIGDRS